MTMTVSQRGTRHATVWEHLPDSNAVVYLSFAINRRAEAKPVASNSVKTNDRCIESARQRLGRYEASGVRKWNSKTGTE